MLYDSRGVSRGTRPDLIQSRSSSFTSLLLLIAAGTDSEKSHTAANAAAEGVIRRREKGVSSNTGPTY